MSLIFQIIKVYSQSIIDDLILYRFTYLYISTCILASKHFTTSKPITRVGKYYNV